MQDTRIRDIVRSYSDVPIRIYSLIRFGIIRQPFLDEIGQYLPHDGRVLDLGCGFGLFSLYFAASEEKRTLVGVDLDARRVELARTSAARLGLSNARYAESNVLDYEHDTPLDAIYMLDCLHHLPTDRVAPLLARLRDMLVPGGTLVLKEVEDRPRWKAFFTLVLDRLMVGMSEPVHYWAADELCDLLREIGFEVKRHRMRDVLPYPHILYVCTAPDRAPNEARS